MTVMVALIRGINVGGSTVVKMADLRRIVEDDGHRDVRTYVQSGNVVFSTRSRSTRAVADRLRTALAQATSAQPEVVVRTRDELHAVIDRNPFADRGAEPTHLHVVFLPGSAPASLPDLARFAPEEAVAVDREVYLHLPGGMGRSKLAAALAKDVMAAGTARNWRTVTTLAEMADASET